MNATCQLNFKEWWKNLLGFWIRNFYSCMVCFLSCCSWPKIFFNVCILVLVFSLHVCVLTATKQQGWVSSIRNIFLPGHPEKVSGQNRKKLDKTRKKMWKMSEMLEKIIIILNFLQRLWLQMHLVNWYSLKTWCRKSITFGLFLPVLSGQNWKKLDDNWETLKDVRNAGKKLIIILIFSHSLWLLMQWVDCYYLETWYRKYITLIYFLPVLSGQNLERTGCQLRWIMERNRKISETLKKHKIK